VVSCEPLGGRIVVELSPSILHPIIDRQLGGGRAEAFSLDRPFTEIERALVDSILERILRALRETWESVKEIGFRVLASESNPFLLEVVPPDERIVLLGFEVRMDGHAGRMHLCIPLPVIEPIRSELSRSPGSSAGRSRGDGECRQRILESIADAPIELTAVLAETRLSLYDLLTLRPGDILSTGARRSSPVAISIEGRERFRGESGVGEAGRVVRVERRRPDR
jgi:flagellar motor switch protein FliM